MSSEPQFSQESEAYIEQNHALAKMLGNEIAVDLTYKEHGVVNDGEMLPPCFEADKRHTKLLRALVDASGLKGTDKRLAIAEIGTHVYLMAQAAAVIRDAIEHDPDFIKTARDAVTVQK